MIQAGIHEPKRETMPRDELEQLQVERLQLTLNRVHRNVAHYHALFDAHGVDPDRSRDLRGLRDIPFTAKEDLRRSYPYDMFAVPLRDIVRIHSTSGTTGRPIVVGYTRNDLRNWTECTARVLAAAGVTEHDVVQIALDYTICGGGFGFQQGAELIGSSVIPSSAAVDVEKQIAIMKDFKTTVLVSTPGLAVSLVAGLEALQVHPERLQLRLGIFGGERWSEKLRREIEGKLHLVSTDTYGLTEVMGPGVAGECGQHRGLHINEDHFIVEVIDPKTLVPVDPGVEGELVFTTITKEGFPLIRYRTGDIASVDPSPCPCGRTFARMSRVTGRTDDLISIQGAAFFPAQVEEILHAAEGTSPHYQIVLDREAGADTLEVKVEVSETIPFLDELRTLEGIRRQIAKRLKTVLGVEAKVTLVEPKSLRQSAAGKGRVVDRRPV